MKRKVWLLLLLLIATATCVAESRSVVRIGDPGTIEVQRLFEDGWDVASRKPGEYLDIVVSETQKAILRGGYPELYVTQTEEQLKENLNPARDIPGYHTYSGMLDQIMQAQAQYPNLVQVTSLGSSWGGIYTAQNLPSYQSFDHQLWAVKVSNNVAETEDEPAFFFVGAHHAREPISTEVCLAILSHLTENYGGDPFVTNLLNTAEIWIVPIINPDGHKIVLDQTDVWWRKNIRDNDTSMQIETGSNTVDGVDINRNYGYKWGYMSASDLYSTPTYHGPEPFSEPENVAFASFITSRRFLAGISYHTYGQYVLYPYGYVYDIEAPDKAEMSSLANEIASVIPKYGSPNQHYDPMPSYSLYPVSGSLDDWVYATTGTFSYTVEMATQFIPPAASIPSIVQGNLAGAMKLLDRGNNKMLQGHVTDAITGNPLRALIHIDGIDDNPIYRTPMYADSLYGSYYRLLPAGEYNVRYIYPGYQTFYTAVHIDPTTITLLDVALQPTQPIDLIVYIENELQQPVANANLVIENLGPQAFTTGENGSISIPSFYPGQYKMVVSKPGYGTLRITRNVASPTITLRIIQSPVIQDGFENGISAWVASSNWATTDSEAFSGTMSLTDSPSGNYQDNNTTFCKLAQPLNLQNVQNACLQFMVKNNLALDGDYLSLQYSLDGQSWKVLWSVSETSDWALQDIDLNSFIGQNIYIRFLLFTGSYYVDDGVYIDDVTLYTSSDVTGSSDPSVPVPNSRMQIFPNPFQQSCRIQIASDTEQKAPATLSIYNLRGQLVREYKNISLTGQGTSLHWDGRDKQGVSAASGIYLFRLSEAGNTLVTSRALFLKQE